MADILTWPSTRTFLPTWITTSSSRCRRIWLLMTATWIMNGVDLLLTMQAHQQGVLVETNPIAHTVLPYGPAAIVAFKVLLVAFGSVIFLSQSQRVLVEVTSWFIALVYVGVSVQWLFCYQAYEVIITMQLMNHSASPLVLGSLSL